MSKESEYSHPLDYRGPPPREIPPLYPQRPIYHGGCVGGCLGAMLCGFILPIAGALYAGLVLRDMGGPFSWPLMMIFGAVAGSLAGAVIGTIVHLTAIFWPNSLRLRRRRG